MAHWAHTNMRCIQLDLDEAVESLDNYAQFLIKNMDELKQSPLGMDQDRLMFMGSNLDGIEIYTKRVREELENARIELAKKDRLNNV